MDKPLPRKREGFTVGTFPANLWFGDGKAVSLLVWLIKSRFLESIGSPVVAVGLLAYTFQRKLSVHLVQVDLQKRFLANYTSPVSQAAGFDCGEAFLEKIGTTNR